MREFIMTGSWRKLAGLLVTQACILAAGFIGHASPEVVVGGLAAAFATFAGAQMGADKARSAGAPKQEATK